MGPFDVGIDSVGGASTPAVWHKLTQHGTLIWCGQASRTRPQLDFFDWEGATSGTIRRFHYLESDVSVAADLETLVRLVATERLHPEIGAVESWNARRRRHRSADVPAASAATRCSRSPP